MILKTTESPRRTIFSKIVNALILVVSFSLNVAVKNNEASLDAKGAKLYNM
jgi:hypothetical protein